jgi:hypothetical protein
VIEKKGKILSYTIALASAWIIGNGAIYWNSLQRVQNREAKLIKPPELTTIVVCAYNEPEERKQQSLQSIIEQNIIEAYPDKFELVVAQQKGKLAARDKAIREANGDVIVSFDADTFYGPNHLNMLLEPFEKPDVIAVDAPTLYRFPLLDILFAIPLKIGYNNKMSGRNSAFTKQAYLDTGGFDLSVNQDSLKQVYQEEELLFRKKLDQLPGEIALVDAPCIHLAGLELGRSWEIEREQLRVLELFNAEYPQLVRLPQFFKKA